MTDSSTPADMNAIIHRLRGGRAEPAGETTETTEGDADVAEQAAASPSDTMNALIRGDRRR